VNNRLRYDFTKMLGEQIVQGEKHQLMPGHYVWISKHNHDTQLTAQQAVAVARRLIQCAGLEMKLECPGHEQGGLLEPCCERAGQYNGYGSDGPRLFTCPKGCSCHD
jgi:hypothetical protein